jgi:hypothetical protein
LHHAITAIIVFLVKRTMPLIGEPVSLKLALQINLLPPKKGKKASKKSRGYSPPSDPRALSPH